MFTKLKNYFGTRARNYGFWVSLFALIPMFFTTFLDINLLPANYEEIISLILGLLVALGICSNPTQGKWYGDQEEKK